MKIYVITHKPFDQKYIKKIDIYQPLLVGASCGNKGTSNSLHDNQGENISVKNKSYCELTGIYWIWKNTSEDIVGIDHYRRYFVKSTKNKKILTKTDIYNSLEDNDIILPQRDPLIYEREKAADFFGECHDPVVWEITREIIKEICPTYIEDFDWYSVQTTGYCYNMFIARSDLINKYNAWLFPILRILEQKVDFSKYNSYNQRMIGFVAERLINVWVHHNKLRVKEYPVIFTEKNTLIQRLKNKLYKVFVS